MCNAGLRLSGTASTSERLGRPRIRSTGDLESCCPTIQRLLLRLRDRVSLPDIFQSFGQGLLFHSTVGMPGVAREYKLIAIAFAGQDLRHILVGEDPVVIVVARAEIVPVADLQPDADRLPGAIGNEVLMELPSPVRGLGIERPLLIHVSA